MLESCVSRFSTICAKNQVLKLKIDKVTVIRVTQFTPCGRPSPVVLGVKMLLSKKNHLARAPPR